MSSGVVEYIIPENKPVVKYLKLKFMNKQEVLRTAAVYL